MCWTAVAAIFHEERRSVGVVDLASGSLRSLGCCRDQNEASWRVNDHLADLRRVCNGIEGSRVIPLVRDPERARMAVRNTPGVDKFGVGDRGQSRDVRNQIGLDKFRAAVRTSGHGHHYYKRRAQ